MSGIRCARGRAAVVAACLVSVACWTGSGAASVASPRAAAPKIIGPLRSSVESPTVSWGRDGGFSVPLPNGKVFWIFGDTPRYTFVKGTWRLTNFIYGSSAGFGRYTAGKPPPKPFSEVVPGEKRSPRNQPAQFLKTPILFMPDGSGRFCNKANGGPQAGANRWVTGAALMPDKVRILISYVGVCVTTNYPFRVESFGFALFNWKKNKFSVHPHDVIWPNRSGAELPHWLRFGSPIIANKKVTFFSATRCDNQECGAPRAMYATTVAANTAALKQRASYNSPKVIPGVVSVPNWTVSQKSKTRPYLTMYQFVGDHGQYEILRAPAPMGPWKPLASGTLPRCTTGRVCVSVALHPEFSSRTRIVASYYVPGWGPGVRGHPDPSGALGHVVLASLPG